jgi:hypothetical protein
MKSLVARVRSIQSALSAGVVLSMVHAGTALAGSGVDLNAGIDTASTSLKGYVGKGVAVAGLLCMVISLGIGGFKFMNKDPHAVWFLIGVVAGGVIFGVASGLLS